VTSRLWLSVFYFFSGHAAVLCQEVTITIASYYVKHLLYAGHFAIFKTTL
jgi:hypothetical protein